MILNVFTLQYFDPTSFYPEGDHLQRSLKIKVMQTVPTILYVSQSIKCIGDGQLTCRSSCGGSLF